MSVPDVPPSQPPPASGRPQGLGGCMAALLVVVGIVVLLPGICSLIFMSMILPGEDGAGYAVGLWVVGFAISAFGIAAIVYAIRHR